MTIREFINMAIESKVDLDEVLLVNTDADYLFEVRAHLLKLPVIGRTVVIEPTGSPVYVADGRRGFKLND